MHYKMPYPFAVLVESMKRIVIFIQKIQAFIYRISDVKLFMLFWSCLVVGYLPAYLALFPGTFGYDGPIQVAQYFGDSALSAHHPLTHTYFMGMFFSLGNALFESYEIGFAMYTAVQGLIVTAAVAYSLLFCKKRNVSIIWIGLGALYLVINPYTQMIVFSSTKDVLFAAFLLLFGTELAYVVMDGRNSVIRLTVFGILMCLFRNQGIYIAIAMLVMIALLRVGKKPLYIGMAVVIGLSQLFLWGTTNLLGIPSADLREMLCVPMQQVAYVTRDFSDTMTEKQRLLVEEVIPMEGIMGYMPTTADPVKNYFDTAALKDNFGEHLQNYIKIGLSHPKQYIQAWRWMIELYWNSEANPYRGLAMYHSFGDFNRWNIEHIGLLQSHYYRLLAATQEEELHIWEKPELCLWIMLGVLVVATVKRDKRRLIILLPFALYFGTILLGPVALVRYLYPLTLATPLLFGMVLHHDLQEEKIDERAG